MVGPEVLKVDELATILIHRQPKGVLELTHVSNQTLLSSLKDMLVLKTLEI